MFYAIHMAHWQCIEFGIRESSSAFDAGRKEIDAPQPVNERSNHAKSTRENLSAARSGGFNIPYLGQDRRESTKSTNRKVAEKLLTARMSAKDQGTLPEGTVTRLCFEDLAVKVEQNYTKKHNRSLDRAQDAFKTLAVKFAGFQTYAITY